MQTAKKTPFIKYQSTSFLQKCNRDRKRHHQYDLIADGQPLNAGFQEGAVHS